MKKPILILKVGTSSITLSNGEIDKSVIGEIARQLSVLQHSHNIVLVSSGAVGTGRRFLNNFSGKLIERKAAAAIGNPILVNLYASYFSEYEVSIAQSLCERGHFSDRNKFLQLKLTFEELWKNNVIPIANENDVVSDLELKFSDNDELATLLAVGLGAEKLLIGTSVEGLLDENNNLIPQINKFTESILGMAKGEKSAFGLGGMISKLTFARMATKLGVEVVIFKLGREDAILKASRKQIGTLCIAQSVNTNARQRWLASGSIVNGHIVIDKGAIKAIKERKSLLAVGIDKVMENFKIGEVFEISDADGNILAIARAKVASDQIMKKEKNMLVANADDIVLL